VVWFKWWATTAQIDWAAWVTRSAISWISVMTDRDA